MPPKVDEEEAEPHKNDGLFGSVVQSLASGAGFVVLKNNRDSSSQTDEEASLLACAWTRRR
jgi:hypothetical protein